MSSIARSGRRDEKNLPFQKAGDRSNTPSSRDTRRSEPRYGDEASATGLSSVYANRQGQMVYEQVRPNRAQFTERPLHHGVVRKTVLLACSTEQSLLSLRREFAAPGDR